MKKILIFMAILFLSISVNVKADSSSVRVSVYYVPDVYYNYKKDGVIYWGQFVFLLLSLCFYVFFLQKILCLKIPFAFSISSITYLLPFHEKFFGVL